RTQEAGQENNGHGGSSADVDFMPIDLVPKVRELEYEFVFGVNHHGDEADILLGNDCLKSVSHVVDGEVMFEGKYDDNDGSLGLVGAMSNDSPVELFTQALDEETHNIVMILIDDIRNDITIEVKNLTNVSNSTLQDCMTEFAVDALGRKLCYRIVVKDSQVIGVLAPLADDIKQLPFLEHVIPPEGSLVKIRKGNSAGIIKNIPTGIIVTNNPKDNFVRKDLQFTREGTELFRKHVADLHGFVDCEVVYENGEWQLEKPDQKAFNVTDLELADEDTQTEYFYVQDSLRSEVTNDITILLDKVDKIVIQLKNKSYKNIDQVKNALKEANETLYNAKIMRCHLTEKQGSNIDSEITTVLNESQTRISQIERELRTLRFETNMM
ncbi:hypothetical protein RFI_11628, partial [Reticulomyxa filosa]